MVPEKKKQNRPAKRGRELNAFKHGAYSSVDLLPWENPDEFEELHRATWEEWHPEGPLEEDCAETIFLCLWRKRRIRARRKVDTAAALGKVHNRVFDQRPPPILLENKIEVVKYSLENIRSPARDDYERLLHFSIDLHLDADPRLVRLYITFLPKELADHLNAKVPEGNCKTTQDWVTALKKEIDFVLLPQIRERRPDPDGYLPVAMEILASGKVIEDLDLEERLDKSMDGAIRRLRGLQTDKQLRRQANAKVVNGVVK